MKRKKISRAERQLVYDKTNGRCAYCGSKISLSDFQIDHLSPFVHGGKCVLENLYAACRSCNHRKGTSDIESFRKQIEAFPSVLQRDNVTYRNAVRFGVVTPTPHKVKFYFEKMEVQDGI